MYIWGGLPAVHHTIVARHAPKKLASKVLRRVLHVASLGYSDGPGSGSDIIIDRKRVRFVRAAIAQQSPAGRRNALQLQFTITL